MLGSHWPPVVRQWCASSDHASWMLVQCMFRQSLFLELTQVQRKSPHQLAALASHLCSLARIAAFVQHFPATACGPLLGRTCNGLARDYIASELIFPPDASSTQAPSGIPDRRRSQNRPAQAHACYRQARPSSAPVKRMLYASTTCIPLADHWRPVGSRHNSVQHDLHFLKVTKKTLTPTQLPLSTLSLSLEIAGFPQNGDATFYIERDSGIFWEKRCSPSNIDQN